MPTTPPAAPRPRRALLFANVAHYYSHVFMLLYPTVVLALEAKFAMSYGALLTLSLPGFVLFGIAALPAGWLGDRWSAPAMLSIFFLGTGLASVLTGFATSPLGLGIGLTAIGLFASIYHPVGTSFVVRHAVNRGRALGLNGVFGTVGIATASVIAGSLTTWLGWRAAFVVPGAISVVTGIAFLATVNQAQPAAAPAATRLDPGISRRQALRALSLLAVSVLCVGLIAQAFLVGLPKVFAVRVAPVGDGGLIGTGALVTIALLLGAGGQIIGGHLADRFSFKAVYIAMYVLMAPLALLAGSLAGGALVAAAVMIQLLLSASLPAENCLVARYCPASWHATAYGAKFVLALGVSSLAVPMVGAIFDRTGGFFWLFAALAAFAATIVAVAVFLPSAAATAKPGGAPAPEAAE